MSAHGGWARHGPLRAGRLVETPDGLLDLATGWPVTLRSHVTARGDDVPPRGPAASPDASGGLVLDHWLTRDWLGRWLLREICSEPGFAGDGCDGVDASPGVPGASSPDTLLQPERDRVGVTRIETFDDWRRLASRARASGLVAIHGRVFAHLCPCLGADWPPALVLVPGEDDVNDWRALLERWMGHGGRVAALAFRTAPPVAVLASVPAAWRACPHAAQRPGMAVAGVRTRQVRRACRALSAAPPYPALRWICSMDGGHRDMTHLELLDVSAQLDEAGRDDEALVLACGAVRRHAEAAHAAILGGRGDDLQVLATTDPPVDSIHLWQRMCRDDVSGPVVSGGGWHAVGRHTEPDGLTVHACACWPSPARGDARVSLLPVFARLVAARVSAAWSARAPIAVGLEQTLVGDSTVMRDVRAQIALAARAPFPVLIRGESGCGKELAARAIHALGPRHHRRCAAINCAALPDDLIESELFGHVRGAFTGAASDRAGLFDDADGGTLFLDEVGELGARAQAKLLRVLQDGEVRRVGENHARRVDVRVIAATNVSLDDAVRRGTFRADLFYRLDVVRVRMPALRERRDDVAMLAAHFWRECSARVGSRARLDRRVLDVLAAYDWPGNVRQLQNTLAALVVRVPGRGRVGVEDLPPEIRGARGPSPALAPAGLDAARREFETGYVREALSRAGGRSTLAARDLGLTRQGLSKLVRRLGLDERGASSRLP